MKNDTRVAKLCAARKLSLAIAAVLSIYAGNGLAAGASASQICLLAGNVVTPTASEAEQLSYMREEEKLARDVYLAMYQKWQQPVFSNIAQSEQTHMDQVKCFLDAYGLPDSARAEAGLFNNSTLQGLYDSLAARGQVSLSEALRVGGMIEELDIRDLEAAIAAAGIAEVKILYENLKSGSENHLRAFVSNLAALGEGYTAQVLSAETVASILGSTGSVPGSGIHIANGNGIQTRAQFMLGLQSGIVTPGAEVPITQRTRLTLRAEIQADPDHIGQMARLGSIATYQPLGSRVVYRYQAGTQAQWQAWNGNLSGLGGSPLQLRASHSLNLYDGTLQNMPGYYQVYSGYRLDDGRLVFCSQPLAFGVLP